MKYPVYQTEVMKDVLEGTVLQTTYYSDGSTEECVVYKYPIVIPPFWTWEMYG